MIKWHDNCVAYNTAASSAEGITCLICVHSHVNDNSTDANPNLSQFNPDIHFHQNTQFKIVNTMGMTFLVISHSVLGIKN